MNFDWHRSEIDISTHNSLIWFIKLGRLRWSIMPLQHFKGNFVWFVNGKLTRGLSKSHRDGLHFREDKWQKIKEGKGPFVVWTFSIQKKIQICPRTTERNDRSKDELFLKVRKFSWEVHHQTTLLTVSSFPLAFSFPPGVSVWRICWERGKARRGDDRKKDAKMTSQSITFCFSNIKQIDSRFPFFCTVKEVHRRRQNLVKTSATFVIYCRLTATWNPLLNWKLHILKGRHHSRICSIVSTWAKFMLQYFLQRHYVLHNRYTVFHERSMGKT